MGHQAYAVMTGEAQLIMQTHNGLAKSLMA